MSFLKISFLMWGFIGGVSLTVEEQEFSTFRAKCKDAAYVTCLRMGVGWLQGDYELTETQRRVVLLELSKAYLFLGKERDATVTMGKIVRKRPCLRDLPGLKGKMALFFKKVRKQVLKEDGTPPILSHEAPDISDLLQKETLEANVTDDFQVRDVVLYYRTSAKAAFQMLPFTKGEENGYNAKLPKGTLRGAGVFEYYIRARDCGDLVSWKGNKTTPISLSLRSSTKSSMRVVGGTILASVGAVLIVGGALSLYVAFNELERWSNTNDVAASEQIRQNVILYNVLGWGGLVLGLTAAGFGAYLLLFVKDKKAAAQTWRVPARSRDWRRAQSIGRHRMVLQNKLEF